MTNENQKRQKEEEAKQKRLLKESRQKAKEAEKENKIRQKAKENAKRIAEKNSTDLPPATASEKAPDNERGADVKPAGDEISTRVQIESDTRSPESSDEEQKKKPVHKNYHVSLRDDGKWQVKFAKGEKALKLFDTQAEAITFAKEKAKNQDGNITIHKTDGKIRKQNYSKRD